MDGRHLSRKTLEELRKIAVQRVLEGVSPELITRIFGFSRASIYRWINRFRSGGDGGLDWHPAPGKAPLINDANRSWLMRTLLNKTPLDFGFQTMLWTQELVKSVIHSERGLALHRSTVGRTLSALGLTPQVPLKRALERNEKAIKKWKEEDFPTLRKKIRKERASLYFLDEMGIRSTESHGTTYSLKGIRPVVESTGKNVGVNVISAVSLTGKMHFMLMEKNFNTEEFLTFLERMMNLTPRKLYIVTDNHSVHQSKITQAFLKTHAAKIEVIFLPTYAPELNPDEWVWQATKDRIKKEPIKSKLDLRMKVTRVLTSLKRCEERISKIFCAPDLSYIFIPP
jgi:transposase